MQVSDVKRLMPGPAFLMMALLAGNAAAFDLLDLFRHAQRYDAVFAASKAQHRAAQERLVQARAGILPKTSFDAVYHTPSRSHSPKRPDVPRSRLEGL